MKVFVTLLILLELVGGLSMLLGLAYAVKLLLNAASTLANFTAAPLALLALIVVAATYQLMRFSAKLYQLC